MTATLLRPGALEGRAVVDDGAYAAAGAEAGATIVAPRADAGEHAGAAAAALVNLARTLDL